MKKLSGANKFFFCHDCTNYVLGYCLMIATGKSFTLTKQLSVYSQAGMFEFLIL